MKLKKMTALLLALLLVFALTACDTKPDASKDSHLDWVSALGTNMGVLTEDGYYYSGNGVLSYIDIATGKSVVLCQKVGCKHQHGLEDEERCDAELDLNAKRMLFDNDTLYYADAFNTLWSRNATGGELRNLGMLAKKFAEEGKRVFNVGISAKCNGYLYYSGNISEIVEGGSDAFSSDVETTGYYIGRYNLDQRKEEILVHQEIVNYGQYIDLIAARETGILYLYQEGLDPEQNWEDLTKRREAMKTMPVEIRYLDLTAGKTTTLLAGTYSEYQTIIAVENGKLFYSGNSLTNRGIRSYDLATGKDTVFYDGEASSTYYGKGYWLRSKWLDGQGKTAEFHIYDANTGKTFPCELSGHFWAIARSAHGMVMLYDNHSTISGYFFLSYDSLADGLQEADLKFLYANS